MAKKSVVERNKKRIRLAEKFAAKRAALKAVTRDESLSAEERFEAQLKLAQLPRNSSKVRVRLRCEISGRGRSNYRKFRMSRIALRELASHGKIPGMVKSSW
ncbi:MAG: 30S ribosomal protein S14 [Rhodospirillaceae bacterium]|jgi:small subunit ribosomal protein S14|nr:30S ribosomal protein S14 [Rhodospirillaceae bacterium]MBT4587762.1 30S ribosomal protein S14 [Rhodospirillaceae bacterium]MBT5939884.1 30S ribosomal protein S14 [Rhodospirillaceae bacterium]MBT7265483.1 30S ribosomal protein S14 [Rhodospirillaceae bacterium]